jgi:sterol-4alpha-carboxylate 3-dehydrogenase (decarboxylating)
LIGTDEHEGPDCVAACWANFVTNGEPMSFWEFIGTVLEKTGLPPTRGAVPYSVAYAAAAVAETWDTLRGGTLNSENGLSRFAVRYMCTHHWFSIERAKRELEWAPAVSLAEGIERTVAAL